MIAGLRMHGRRSRRHAKDAPTAPPVELSPLEAAYGEIEWRRVGREWHLTDGRRVFATLASHGVLTRTFLAQVAGASWTLAESGFLRHRLTVLDRESGRELGVMTLGLAHSSGELQLASGIACQWRSASLWGRRWRFVAPRMDDIELRPHWARSRCAVELPLSARRSSHAPLLLCVGLCVVLAIARLHHHAAGV